MSARLSLAQDLRARRSGLGLTQAELAERAGISERAVSDMERGLRRTVYRDTAQRLARALELSGEEATQFEALARGRTAAALDLPEAAGPVPRTPMLGRAAQLAAVAKLLQDPATRLVTLTGPGGVGKTRLAVELWKSMADKFSDGVVWVSLGELERPDMVLPTIAGSLRLRVGKDAAASVAAQLSGKRLLLILDTLEHLLAAAPDLAELVAHSAPSTFLATSRLPLNIRAERLLAVPPLSQADAVAMFAGCVASQRPDLAHSLDNAVAADICRRLDGLPLAIELAAARVRLLGTAQIKDHLEHRLPLLTDGPVDLPQRQRSMTATIAWSYDLLPGEERRLLEQLSVFAGSWTLASSASVCALHEPILLNLLSGLVDSSLVLPEMAGPWGVRYRMLDTVREYAADRLASRNDTAAVSGLKQKHAEHFRALVEEIEPNLRAGGHQASVERLTAENDNLRAALSWAIASHDTESALRIAGSLWMFWRVTGAFAEGRAWLRQVLEMEGAGQFRGAALWGAGWLAYQQGDHQETADRGRELVERARLHGDSASLRNGLTLLGEERLAAGDFGAAAAHFEDALGLARKLGSGWLLATSCLNRSVAAGHLGDLDGAEALLTEAEALYRELGDDRFTAKVWLQQAYIALTRGNRSRARELVMGGLANAFGFGDRWGVAEQLDGLAAVLASEGDGRAASFAAGVAARTWQDIGAAPHPADRRSTDRWLAPAVEADPEAVAAAFAEGREMAVEEAVPALLRAGAGAR